MHRQKSNKVDPYGFAGFNPISVGLLRELVKLSDAKIVLSSTWRMHYTTDEDCINEFKSMMEKHYDWNEFPIIGRTIVYGLSSDNRRGNEIKQYLDLHHYMNYVILDDSNDMLESQQNNFVRVDYREGFNFNNFVKCLNIFGISSDFTLM